jgi:hypothetical protein
VNGARPGPDGGSRVALPFPPELEQYAPPFDLTADMLLVLALCPTAPLRRVFPEVPFLSLLGRTPLVLWFSHVTEVCYRDPAGARRCDQTPRAAQYDELNVAALLWERAFFVPGIYATGELSILIGRHYYSMPKEPTTMRLRVNDGQFRAAVADSPHRSYASARLLGTSPYLARLLSRRSPWRLWPARFPDVRQSVRGVIQVTPTIRPALVYGGQLALRAAWLPCPVPLLPVGVYLPGLRMQLPRLSRGVTGS